MRWSPPRPPRFRVKNIRPTRSREAVRLTQLPDSRSSKRHARSSQHSVLPWTIPMNATPISFVKNSPNPNEFAQFAFNLLMRPDDHATKSRSSSAVSFHTVSRSG